VDGTKFGLVAGERTTVPLEGGGMLDGTTDGTTMGLIEGVGSAADGTAMGLVAGAGWEDGRTTDGIALSLEGNNDGTAAGGILECCSSCSAGVTWDGCATASRCDIATRRGIGASADAGETLPGSDARYDRGSNATRLQDCGTSSGGTSCSCAAGVPWDGCANAS
jgi:hypothetical protein